MFDRKFTLPSSDETVSLFIDADSGGLKSLQIICPPWPPLSATQQELMDGIKNCLRQMVMDANPPAPSAPPDPAP